MPQYPGSVAFAINPDGVNVPLKVDDNGALITASETTGGDVTTLLNLGTAEVVFTGKGTLEKVIVNTAGTAAGSIHDITPIGSVAAGNLLATIPNTVGVYNVGMPIEVGLAVSPGAGGMVVALSYSPEQS